MKMIKKLALLLCVVLALSVFSVAAFAAEEATIVIEANDTGALPGETVEFTVYLDNADKMDGGVWHLEFKVSLPEGLTYVEDSAVVYSDVFDGAFFNKNLKWGCKGLYGEGYTGGKLALVTFQCTVNEGAAGDLVVTTVENSLCVTDKDGNANYPAAPVFSLHVCGNLEDVAEVPATCTTEGVKAHQKCSCGKLYLNGVEVTEADLVIAKAAHSFGEWETVEAATCVKKGQEKRVCSVCGEIETREVDMVEHKHDEVWAADEIAHWHICQICEEALDYGEHTYDEGVKDGEGWIVYTCTVCGYAHKDEVPDFGDMSAIVFALAAVSGMGLIALTKKKED